MPNTNLPALPKPDTHCFDEDSGKDCWSHSPEQVRAYGQSCYEAGRVAGLEEAKQMQMHKQMLDKEAAQRRHASDWASDPHNPANY